MSKLIDAMQIRATGNRFAELGKVEVTKNEDFCDKNYINDFIEYKLGVVVVVGVRLVARSDEIHYLKDQAEHMVREEVFGEYRKVFHEIRFAAYNRNFEEVNRLVSVIERSMFDV